MLIGVFLNYIKNYRGQHFIPLNQHSPCCGILGANGIGKSAILESLDALFNNKEFNYNLQVKKSGFKKSKPYFIPVFLIDKNEIKIDKNLSITVLESLSNSMWSSSRGEEFSRYRDHLQNNGVSKDSHYLIPIGLKDDGDKKYKSVNLKQNEEANLGIDNSFKEALFEKIIGSYTYVYIPKEIRPEDFTKLETDQIQKLLGEDLSSIIDSVIPKKDITSISTAINDFINDLSSKLDGYIFKSIGDREQKNMRKKDIHNLIIKNFFTKKVLHKMIDNDKNLPIGKLSSGEQQNALINLAHQILKNHRKTNNNVILAIDEPETSLHISICYEQFNKLINMSKYCKQIIFTTHWYGFIPVADNCDITLIEESSDSNKRNFYFTNSTRYREDIKKSSNKKINTQPLPFDVDFKGFNDLTQSIIITSRLSKPYNWLICEGNSDKIYLDKYFHHLVDSYNLRIIPVSGCNNIEKIYSIINVFLSNDAEKEQNKGKIIFLTDTDDVRRQVDKSKSNNLYWYRLINSKNDNFLTSIDSKKGDTLDIEGAVNGKLLFNILNSQNDTPDELKKIIRNKCYSDDELTIEELNSREKDTLKEYFKYRDGIDRKSKIAELYVSSPDFDNTPVPQWIKRIETLIKRQ